MIKLDESKLNSLKYLHWNWFWTRATYKEISFSMPQNANWHIPIRKFFQLFFDWGEDELKKIITANSKQVMKFADKNSIFYKKFKNNYDILCSATYLGSSSSVQKILLEAFGYDDFINGITRPFQAGRVRDPSSLINWYSYTFTEQMMVDVCPYCNRQYIFTLLKGEGRPEIDHFYPKSDYPYLSCTLANFIPSCHQCNHQKSDDFNIHVTNGGVLKNDIYYVKNRSRTIYPYQDSFETLGVKFCIKYENNAEKKVDFEINQHRNTLKWKMVQNSIKAFHLKELYNCQKIEINDLLKRYEKYSNPKIKNILETIILPSLGDKINELKSRFSSTNNSDEYINEFLGGVIKTYIESSKNEILGIPIDNDGKDFPFKKFKEDIIKQFDEEHQMVNYWAWGGKYIGFRKGVYLYSKEGNPIGHFDGDEIFDFNGKYLCDVIDDRLITKLGSRATGKTMQKPNNMSRKPCSNYAGYAMLPGYQDFIWKE